MQASFKIRGNDPLIVGRSREWGFNVESFTVIIGQLILHTCVNQLDLRIDVMEILIAFCIVWPWSIVTLKIKTLSKD